MSLIYTSPEGLFLEAVSPAVCFSAPVPLTDQAGPPLSPDLAFGFDFNGDGTDDLIVVDTVSFMP